MSLPSAVEKFDQPVLVSANDSTGDLSLALGFDDLGDLFLERSDSDELVNLKFRFLADSEGTVGCLVLDGGGSTTGRNRRHGWVQSGSALSHRP
jgi:hypothetical protein